MNRTLKVEFYELLQFELTIANGLAFYGRIVVRCYRPSGGIVGKEGYQREQLTLQRLATRFNFDRCNVGLAYERSMGNIASFCFSLDKTIGLSGIIYGLIRRVRFLLLFITRRWPPLRVSQPYRNRSN